MSWRYWAAEKRHWVLVLEEHDAKTIGGRVALEHKRLGKVGQGQDRRGCDGDLQSIEGSCSLGRSGEAPFAEERGERRSNDTVVLHKLPVIACESKEATDGTRRALLRSLRNRLHLGRVHGHTASRDDVAQVGDGLLTKGALGVLGEKVVLVQDVEDDANVSQVLRPRTAED
jgi:hypothetical protein